PDWSFLGVSDTSWVPEYIGKIELRYFGSLEELLLCYAYDVFRRGWKYQETSRRAPYQPWYFPHHLRNTALEGIDGWVQTAISSPWSWGKCIVEVVKDPARNTERSAARVADMILAIKAAMLVTGCPKRLQFPLSRPESFNESEVHALIELLEATAHDAKLPLTRLMSDSTPRRLAQIGIEGIREELRLGVIEEILRVLPFKNVHAQLDRRIADAAANLANLFRKGTYGYRGLVGEELKARAGE
ncbi:MAG: hypothetical protein WBM04_00115, partial [Candidatus Korobacteraceae bacterium]